MINSIFKISVFLFLTIALFSCGGASIPRPYGYFRVEMPDPQYHKLDTLNLPYTFERSHWADVRLRNDEANWIDINYPAINASIHCSYFPINGNLYDLLEDSRKYVYKHTVKADGISENVYEDTEKRVFGIMYELKGNTASNLQFVLTDSVKHFFRASMYFDNVPNKDSIAPMAEYVRRDMIRLIETFEWK